MSPAGEDAAPQQIPFRLVKNPKRVHASLISGVTMYHPDTEHDYLADRLSSVTIIHTSSHASSGCEPTLLCSAPAIER